MQHVRHLFKLDMSKKDPQEKVTREAGCRYWAYGLLRTREKKMDNDFNNCNCNRGSLCELNTVYYRRTLSCVYKITIYFIPTAMDLWPETLGFLFQFNPTINQGLTIHISVILGQQQVIIRRLKNVDFIEELVDCIIGVFIYFTYSVPWYVTLEFKIFILWI